MLCIRRRTPYGYVLSVCRSHLSTEIVLPSVSGHTNYSFCHIITREQLNGFSWNLILLCHWKLVHTRTFLISSKGCSNLWGERVIIWDDIYTYDLPQWYHRHDIRLYKCTLRTAEQVFMKFGIDVMQLECAPNSFFISYSQKYQRYRCSKLSCGTVIIFDEVIFVVLPSVSCHMN
jgi:hypothetical protein